MLSSVTLNCHVTRIHDSLANFSQSCPSCSILPLLLILANPFNPCQSFQSFQSLSILPILPILDNPAHAANPSNSDNPTNPLRIVSSILPFHESCAFLQVYCSFKVLNCQFPIYHRPEKKICINHPNEPLHNCIEFSQFPLDRASWDKYMFNVREVRVYKIG